MESDERMFALFYENFMPMDNPELILTTDISSLIEKYGPEFDECTGYYVDRLDRLGNPESRKCWLLLAHDHEGDFMNEKLLLTDSIDIPYKVIVYANDMEEADKLLKTYPHYMLEMNEKLTGYPKLYDEVKDDSVLEYIFGYGGYAGGFHRLSKTEHKLMSRYFT